MLATVYKNNNVLVRHEPGFDGEAPSSLAGLLEAMSNGLDAPEVWNVEECYPHVLVTLFVNGAPRRYFVNESDAERYATGRAVRLVYQDDAPLFALPRFYSNERFELDGRKGTLFALCETPGREEREAMEAAGCALLKTIPQYAPEIERTAVFVPAGTPFEYA